MPDLRQTAVLSRAQARNLRKAAADIDIWRGGLERVFGRNEFNFYHPLYFLHYLDKAGFLEFNPYEKFKKIKPRHPHSSAAKSKFAEHYNSPIEVLSNPGFAPAVNTNSDSVRFPYSHSGLFYGAVNWCYQCSIYADPDMVGKQHTGVDFAGYEGTPMEVFECENSIEKKKVINVEADENIEMKWKDNVRWNRNKRVDPFNHDEHGGKR